MQPSNDLLALAGTLFGEIRGGTVQQQENVAQVILNRHTLRNQTVRQVCLAPKQFSCWNPSDVNRVQILNADKAEPNTWNQMVEVAHRALIGQISSPVGTVCQNYYAKGSEVPYWAKVSTARVILDDGLHLFVVT